MNAYYCLLITVLFFALNSYAEPFLAVKSGLKCAACHVNPGGGGQRNTFGNRYGHSVLPANNSDSVESLLQLTSGKQLSLGANARTGVALQDVDDRDDASEFGVDSVKLYLSARVTEHVMLYIDQQIAPGGSLNRESWIAISNRHWHMKLGRIFLPFGWRIEDDGAFIRQATGINFDSPDNGLEIGFDATAFNLQVAISNGTAGAAETDDGKQASLRMEYLNARWRIGVSGNINSTDAGKRSIYGVFAGVKTGPISWLAEWDSIEDRDFDTPDQQLDVLLVEANYSPIKGHNFKLSTESLDSDIDAIAIRYRHSVVWEYFPLTATQIRAGFRQFDSDNNSANENREEGFVQLHLFF